MLTRHHPAAETAPAPEPRGSRSPGSPVSRSGDARRTYLVLVGLIVVLNLAGLVMVLSASSIESLRLYGSPWHYFERQSLWMLLGVLAFTLALKVAGRALRRLAKLAMATALGLLVAVLVPGVGVHTAGASRWLGTASIQVQPSEFAKLALVLFAADLLDRRADRSDWRYRMFPVVSVLAVLAVLVMAQPDMGTTLVLASIAIGMLFTAGIPFGPLTTLFFGAGACGLLVAVAAPYRWHRMTSFLHPLSDASNTGYQSAQGLAALGNGKVIGAGIGSSIASWGYLPNAKTDFIFAVIGEETGLVGALALTGLFGALALLGTRIACRARDRYSALVAAGVTVWLVSQAVINIGAVVGLLPVTGVPLPFVSFGGSSLVIAMFGAGVLANVARRS